MCGHCWPEPLGWGRAAHTSLWFQFLWPQTEDAGRREKHFRPHHALETTRTRPSGSPRHASPPGETPPACSNRHPRDQGRTLLPGEPGPYRQERQERGSREKRVGVQSHRHRTPEPLALAPHPCHCGPKPPSPGPLTHILSSASPPPPSFPETYGLEDAPGNGAGSSGLGGGRLGGRLWRLLAAQLSLTSFSSNSAREEGGGGGRRGGGGRGKGEGRDRRQAEAGSGEGGGSSLLTARPRTPALPPRTDGRTPSPTPAAAGE